MASALCNYWLINRTRDNETNTETPQTSIVPDKFNGEDDEDKKKAIKK